MIGSRLTEAPGMGRKMKGDWGGKFASFQFAVVREEEESAE
jgi:hypothetical protein